VTAIEDGFRASSSDLNFAVPRDRVVGFYVRRRAVFLAGQNPGWAGDQLAVALMGERATIMGYITQKLAALVTGPDSATPRHLDLAAQAQALVGQGSLAAAALAGGWQKIYTTNRTDWIWQIVWRAMAIHGSDLWKSATPPRELQQAALDELLDRRLHAVERMTCTVNAALGSASWQPVTSVQGPWKDGITVRVVEYPWLPKAPFAAVLPQMTDWQVSGDNLFYKPGPHFAPTRMPKNIAASWSAKATQGGTLWVDFKPGAAAGSDVIQKMFAIPRDDFLNRAWLFCDMVGAAVCIEALWLGLSRRSTADAAAFDTMMNKPGYASLGPVVRYDGNNDLDTLMADGADDVYFENTQIDAADLQVGDFVVFWNSRIYNLIWDGAWGNEFSLIMGLDSDPASGNVRTGADGPQIWLAGHGLATSRYSAMASELGDQLKGILASKRNQITSALARNPAATTVDSFVKWAPYEDFQAPGAWWLQISQKTWKDDWAYASKDQAVRAISRAVADDPAAGTGYRHPPDPDAIYFPLWEPRVPQASSDADSWQAYLRLRRADASYRAPAALAEIQANGSLASGLFYRGSTAKIPVVRPRIRK
jgi:hypothetical protein